MKTPLDYKCYHNYIIINTIGVHLCLMIVNEGEQPNIHK